MPICDVCNTNTTQRVICSKLMPQSNAYCDPCFEMGVEPWNDFVATLFACDIYTEKAAIKKFGTVFITRMEELHGKKLKNAIKEARKAHKQMLDEWK